MALRILPVILAIVLLGSAARANHEETERRLKTAGVQPELRERIHAAIDRSVAFLLKKQLKGGGWSRRLERGAFAGAYPIADLSPLPALALRHAGTPAGKAGALKAIARLFPPKTRGLATVHDDIYLGGITCMLLMADRSHADIAGEISRRIAGSWDRRSKWWGYLTTQGRSRYSIGDFVNLSTTQFAALGMWAGDRMRARIDKRYWRGHLESLCRTQCEDGSWSYFPQRRKSGYPTGTFMGMANFLLAHRALKDVLAEDARFARIVGTARVRGLAKMHEDAATIISGLERGGNFSYYGLYALEKACVFANTEWVNGVRWYVRGADVLCELQNKDGGWGMGRIPGRSRATWIPKSNLVDTSFGLLFLLRSSETYHPVTPRPVDSAKETTTPGVDEAPEAKPEPKAPPPPGKIEVEISFAWKLLERLEALLDANRAPNEEIQSALARVRTALAGLVPDPGGEPDRKWRNEAARWTRSAGRLVFSAAILARVPPNSKRNMRQPVNLNALRMLAGFDEDKISPLLIEAFEKSIFQAKGYEPEAVIYETGFRTLANLNSPKAFLWLAEDVIDTDSRPHRTERTRAALRALVSFTAMTGADRHAAFKRILRVFVPGARSASSPAHSLTLRLDKEIIDVLRHLGRDQVTGRAPIALGRWVGTVPAFERWFHEHRDVKRPPWASR
jgi:hypothetical protein